MDYLRRVAAVLLQIVIPGYIGVWITILALFSFPFPLATWIYSLGLVIFGGAVVGFLTWLIGLIADRPSLSRLVVTVACAALGVAVVLVLVRFQILSRLRSDLGWIAAIAPQLAGGMVGYYLWGKLRTMSAAT